MSEEFLIGLWPQVLGMFALNIVVVFLFVRVVVQRLRDAGIAQKWAYLLAIPIIDILMTIALIFYPPSKEPAPAEAVA